MREMCIAMARAHRDWCKKNLEAWEEARKEISNIPDHPNRKPEGEAGPSATGAPTPAPGTTPATSVAPNGTRRDSDS